VRILLRGDSGFAREELMAWCDLPSAEIEARALYEELYCARRVGKPHQAQLELFADRLSAATFRANQPFMP
jgi:hypothetical protein